MRRRYPPPSEQGIKFLKAFVFYDSVKDTVSLEVCTLLPYRVVHPGSDPSNVLSGSMPDLLLRITAI
jgi:hypothetical protein